MGCTCLTEKPRSVSQYESFFYLTGNLVIRRFKLEEMYELVDGFETSKLGVIRNGRLRGSPELYEIRSFYKKMCTDLLVPLANELNVLSELSHPNLEKIYHIFETGSTIHLVTDLEKGQSLASLTSLDIQQVSSYTRQMLLCLKYLHGRGILHKHLSPETIFVYEGKTLKVKGFLFSKERTEIDALGEEFTTKTDILLLGKVLKKMLRLSNYSENTQRDENHIHFTCNKFLAGVTASNPHERFSVDEALNHPWINSTAS